MNTQNSFIQQSGNVLFYILIAVALIAALSFAVVQSNRGSVTNLTAEQTRLYANEIISYANTMAQTVGQLRLRGVDDSDLCFDHADWGVADYDHGGCSDNFNHIFHTSGGSMNWKKLEIEATESSATPDYLWHIYGSNEIEDIGSTCGNVSCADLIVVADELKLDICLKINDLLGVTNPSDAPPTDTNLDSTRYVGSFSNVETIGDEAGGAVLAGKNAACFQKTDSPAKYTFYKVLLSR